MALDELAELLAIALGLASSHTWDVLQLVDGDGIGGGHSFQRWVLENDVWRQVELLRHLLAQVFQHAEQGGVECH